MHTGIVLITHEKIATTLINTAKMILQQENLNVGLVEVPSDCNTQEKFKEAQQLLKQYNQGQGVLILNDIVGATPFNIAKQLNNNAVNVISGLNLNMLLRALTYQYLPLSELTEKTREGGINGVRYIK